MATPNDANKSGKKLDPAAAQKMRDALANRVAELSDEDLSAVAGGTATILPSISQLVDSINIATHQGGYSRTGSPTDLGGIIVGM